MRVDQKTVSTSTPVVGKGVVVFDNYDIVRLVRAEAQRQLGVSEDKIVETAGSVVSVHTNNTLPRKDLIRVEI